nr:DUF3772 domain-containing protein [Candidatus Rhodoblastus alkanivorans]
MGGAVAPTWSADTAAPAATEAPAPVDPAKSLDSVKQSLDKIEAQIVGDSLTDGELIKLRGALDPISAQIQAVIAEVAPKLAAVKARLDQLGKPPDLKANPSAAPEDPAVTKERDDQQKLFTSRDDLIKRANLAQLRVDQIASQIAERRRTLFANSVFQASSSIASPKLWMSVAGEAPRGFSAAHGVLMDFVSQASEALAWRNAWMFGLSLLALIVAIVAATLLARRVIPRERSGRTPSEWQKAAAALWTAAAVAIIPVGGAMGFFALARWFGLGGDEFRRLSAALFRGVVEFALAVGIGNALLAPNRPKWRPVDLSDRVARRLMNLILVVITLITLGKLFEALDATVGSALPVSVAARGTFALLVGLALTRGLYGIVAAPDVEESPSGRPGNLVDESPWWPPIRFAAWAATIAVIGADLLGYVALSSFLVDQIAWMALIISLLFLFLKLASEGLEGAFGPNSRLSRALIASIGLRRESLAQIGALLSGVVSLTLYAVAALLVIAPWGLQSHDMVGAMKSAFFGFKIGGVTISPWSLLVALALFALGYTVTSAIQNWLEKRYLPLTQIDQGLKASIRVSIGYIGVLLSLLFAVAFLGINLERLALVAGALSVGIGLGLQSVVNNFVSGLILLWERAIRVGDLVVIGDDQGYVRRINVRATEIETFDRATMIVPNGNIMTGVVKNYVRGDRIGRVKIPIQVLWGSEPEKVRETLLDVAKSHEEVVGIPAATVLFTNLGLNSLDFELICFVENVERTGRVKSDLLFAIFSRLAESGIRMTGSTPEMNVSLPHIEPMLDRYFDRRSESKA